MDTKSKNSHKLGVIIVVFFLFICSLLMMNQYGLIRQQLESETDQSSRQQEALLSMGDELIEGSYILYNEYSQETELSDFLNEYGQRDFDLTRKFMEYGVFDSEGKSLLDETTELESTRLQRAQQYYAFWAEYDFSDEGELSAVQVSGKSLTAQEEYDLESSYLNDAENAIYGGYVTEITEPAGVKVVYGMTSDSLASYTETVYPQETGLYTLYTLSSFRDMFEILILVVIAAALLLPCIKRLDISEMKVFRVPFEIPVLVLFFLMAADVFWMTGSVVYSTVEGSRLSSGPGMLMNVLMWMCVFGIFFWAFTSLRAIIRMKGAYWRERTLTRRLFRWIRYGEGGGKKIREGTAGMFRKGKKFFADQYDALLHLDFQDRTNRMILKIVAVNFIILAIVCLFWFYGMLALIVYSILLFLFLRRFTKDLQDKYGLLLQSTNELAEGHLDVPIEGDMGLFNPIREELKKIQKGFKKAVEEEVKNERMKTELVTNVSHDLRTPLTAIITYTDLLKNETDEEKRKEYIEVLEKKSLRLKVLIEDLFEISKAASKSVKMNYMKVDIVDLLKQVGLENDSRIREADLEFRWKLPEHKIVMWLDSQKTYRIFENLIVNITKYAMPHTRVYIEMTDGEKGVHISMKNVSAAELDFNVDEITDRFVRGDSSRNTEGSGLGLAIAKSFVELQHGMLKISTEADLFKADITLPKMEMPEEPQETE
ncbi:MAG TPA: HAMP domain-containing histidine kinase [Candidatus Mediterraneibacter excrementigallinarum]|nr:HAMP domain-containing histidine kinase [Candidatus Mediterraneibacter excrementigallinarum]